MSCYVRDLETLNERARGLGFANEIMRYLVLGKGMMTFGASLCAASVKVLPESATPDLQCVFAPASYNQASFAGSTTGLVLPADRGRCGRCRAAMS